MSKRPHPYLCFVPCSVVLAVAVSRSSPATAAVLATNGKSHQIRITTSRRCRSTNCRPPLSVSTTGKSPTRRYGGRGGRRSCGPSPRSSMAGLQKSRPVCDLRQSARMREYSMAWRRGGRFAFGCLNLAMPRGLICFFTCRAIRVDRHRSSSASTKAIRATIPMRGSFRPATRSASVASMLTAGRWKPC
jgi:hypothetical protein